MTRLGKSVTNVNAEWERFLRCRDLEQLLSSPPGEIKGKALEIGCGSGYLTGILGTCFEEIIPTDVKPRGTVPGVVMADAQKLPFVDQSFDFVFSSNVLEHIDDVYVCLEELRRVMAPGATMLHTMPTSSWKVFQVLTHPIHLLMIVFKKFLRRNNRNDRIDNSVEKVGEGARGRSLIAKATPAIHGISSNHFREFLYFRPSSWKTLFERTGFEVLKVEPLFFHSPYKFLPFRFMKLRMILARIGLASVRGYWLRNNAVGYPLGR